MVDQFMNCLWLSSDKGFKEGMDFLEIHEKIHPLLAEENEKRGKLAVLSNPYQ